MILSTHMFRDTSLLNEVRQAIGGNLKAQQPSLEFDIKRLEKNPLLLSLYAETLRFGVQIHIPRCSPHQDIQTGGKTIPMDKLILINTWLAHTDERKWNTQDGKHPLDKFWPRRFLATQDDDSGPLKSGIDGYCHPKVSPENTSETFSLDGLDGVWIPYGGMHLNSPSLKQSNTNQSLSSRWTTCLSRTNLSETNYVAFDCYDCHYVRH